MIRSTSLRRAKPHKGGKLTEKEIQIGERKVKFGASGALPVIYRDITGRDFFSDLQSMSESVNGTVLDIAWAMHRDAEPEDSEDEKEWLRRFDFADINSAIPEIIALLSSANKTTSSAKKKNAPLTGT